MAAVQSFVKDVVKRGLARQGILLVRARRKFGFDPWLDIHHLAAAWKYSVNLLFDVGANDGEQPSLHFGNFQKRK